MDLGSTDKILGIILVENNNGNATTSNIITIKRTPFNNIKNIIPYLFISTNI